MSVLRDGLCSRLTSDILEKLRSSGITKTTDLISRDLEDTCQLTGISYKVKIQMSYIFETKTERGYVTLWLALSLGTLCFGAMMKKYFAMFCAVFPFQSGLEFYVLFILYLLYTYINQRR